MPLESAKISYTKHIKWPILPDSPPTANTLGPSEAFVVVVGEQHTLSNPEVVILYCMSITHRKEKT